jgi:hypothetical protein
MANSDATATAETTDPSSSEGRARAPDIGVPPPGAAARARRYVPVPLDVLADTGQPVDIPPPLIEPIIVGFDEPEPPPDPPRHQLPPRPNFLRVTRPPTPVSAAPAAEQATPAIGEPAAITQAAEAAVEPIAQPGAEPRLKRAWLWVRTEVPSLTQQWRRAVAIPQPGDPRRLVYLGGWAAAVVIVVAIGFSAGFGLFHRPAHRSVAPLSGAPSDPAQRLAYFQNGAQAGDPEAELQLAILYAKGEGVTQDYTIAAKWFRAAAEQDLPRAQYDLGVLYERGRGVAADPMQAASWYLKAAEGKYPLAQYNLAVAYTKGEGTRKDPAEAALWYRRAAGQGVVQAMVNLGMLYERGEGVSVSPVDAYAWYLVAGRRGNQPAARRAEELFAAFSQLEQVSAQALANDVAGSIHDPAPDTAGG